MATFAEIMEHARTSRPKDWQTQIMQDGFPEVLPEELDSDPHHLEAIIEGDIFSREFATIRQGEVTIPLRHTRRVVAAAVRNENTGDVSFEHPHELGIDTSQAPVLSLKDAIQIYRGQDHEKNSLATLRKKGSSRAFTRVGTTIREEPVVESESEAPTSLDDVEF